MTGQEDMSESVSFEDSYRGELLGVDPQTGQSFTRVRQRKPMRYYLPGLIGGHKNMQSI